MNSKFLFLFALLMGFQFSSYSQKAEPNKVVTLKINGTKVELIDSKVKIADLKNAKLELECNGHAVTILKHKLIYSSKDLTKVASLEGEGAPTDISSPKWEATVGHKHHHAGALIMISLTYGVLYLDDDASKKETTWMITLE